MATMSWTVYTARDDEVIATTWTDDRGPGDAKRVAHIPGDSAAAEAEAVRLQLAYDNLRRRIASA